MMPLLLENFCDSFAKKVHSVFAEKKSKVRASIAVWSNNALNTAQAL
jgi:hypothetical protein